MEFGGGEGGGGGDGSEGGTGTGVAAVPKYISTLRAQKAGLRAELELGRGLGSRLARRTLLGMALHNEDRDELKEFETDTVAVAGEGTEGEALLRCELRDMNLQSIRQLRETRVRLQENVREAETRLALQRKQLSELDELSRGLRNRTVESDVTQNEGGGEDDENEDDDRLKRIRNVGEQNALLKAKLLEVLNERFPMDGDFWQMFVSGPRNLQVTHQQLSSEGISALLATGLYRQVDDPVLNRGARCKLEVVP